MDVSAQQTCPSCHTAFPFNTNFCPQCGHKFKEPPLSTSIGRQLFLYLFSFFLAPLGLHFAFKYMRQPDIKERTIGVVILLLTIAAITVAITLTKTLYDTMYGSLGIL